MRTFWLFCLLPLCYSSLAYCETTGKFSTAGNGGAIDNSESKLVEIDGVNGLWFPMPKAKLLLKDVSRLPYLEKEIELKEKRISLSVESLDLLIKNQVSNESVIKTWKDLAEKQAKQLNQKDPWYKSPYLWLGVGALLGGGLVVGAVSAARK